MGFSPMEEQIVYMLKMDLLSTLVTLSPKADQLLLIDNFVFDFLLSLLPDLLFMIFFSFLLVFK